MEHNYIVYIIKDNADNFYFHFTRLKELNENTNYENTRDKTTMLYNVITEINRQYKKCKEGKKYNHFYDEIIEIFAKDIEKKNLDIMFYYDIEKYEKLKSELEFKYYQRKNKDLEFNTYYGYYENLLQLKSRYKYDNLTLAEMKKEFNLLISGVSCLNKVKKTIPQHIAKQKCPICKKEMLVKNLKPHIERCKVKHNIED